MTKERKAEFLMIIVTVIWGLGFPITQLAIENGFGSYTIMSFRFIIAATLLPIIFYKRIKYLNIITAITGLVTGVFLFIGFYFQTIGLAYTTASNSAFITQSVIIITPFIMWLIFKNKPANSKFLAAFVAFIGIIVLSVNFNDISSFNKGDLFTLISALATSFHVTLTSVFSKKYNLDAVLYTEFQMVFAGVLSLILAISLESLPVINSVPLLDNDISTILLYIYPLLFIGVFNTTFGFTVQTYAIQFTSPTRTNIILSQEATIGAIFSAILLNEPLTTNIIIGGLLILFAIYLSESKKVENRLAKSL